MCRDRFFFFKRDVFFYQIYIFFYNHDSSFVSKRYAFSLLITSFFLFINIVFFFISKWGSTSTCMWTLIEINCWFISHILYCIYIIYMLYYIIIIYYIILYPIDSLGAHTLRLTSSVETFSRCFLSHFHVRKTVHLTH